MKFVYIYIYIYIYIFVIFLFLISPLTGNRLHIKEKEPHFDRGSRNVMLIVVGNGHNDTNSNPGLDRLHFI